MGPTRAGPRHAALDAAHRCCAISKAPGGRASGQPDKRGAGSRATTRASRAWTSGGGPAKPCMNGGPTRWLWRGAGLRGARCGPACGHGKTGGVKGHTPAVNVAGPRQSVSAASAVNSTGGFWYATDPGGVSGEKWVAWPSATGPGIGGWMGCPRPRPKGSGTTSAERPTDAGLSAGLCPVKLDAWL